MPTRSPTPESRNHIEGIDHELRNILQLPFAFAVNGCAWLVDRPHTRSLQWRAEMIQKEANRLGLTLFIAIARTKRMIHAYIEDRQCV